MIAKRELEELKANGDFQLPSIKKDLTDYVTECHQNAVDHGFYERETVILWKIANGMTLSYEDEKAIKMAFICQKLLLNVSEIAEAMEALRNNDWHEFREEIADQFIRGFDLCGSLGIDLQSEVDRKMAVNEARPKMHGGKLF